MLTIGCPREGDQIPSLPGVAAQVPGNSGLLHAPGCEFMNIDSQPLDRMTHLMATDHLDPDGSVVRSGVALADAAIRALEKGGSVSISLRGLKGASSSYFNVFLRRIEEACGLGEIGRDIHLEFDSSVQEMIYQRSFESRGPRMPPDRRGTNTVARKPSVWKSVMRLLRGG